MKTDSKLKLRTETIMSLQSDDLAGVHGGGTPATAAVVTARSSAHCVRATIAAGRSSAQCAQKIGESAAKTNDWAKDKLGVSF